MQTISGREAGGLIVQIDQTHLFPDRGWQHDSISRRFDNRSRQSLHTAHIKFDGKSSLSWLDGEVRLFKKEMLAQYG